jgi:hypothetical protein
MLKLKVALVGVLILAETPLYPREGSIVRYLQNRDGGRYEFRNGISLDLNQASYSVSDACPVWFLESGGLEFGFSAENGFGNLSGAAFSRASIPGWYYRDSASKLTDCKELLDHGQFLAFACDKENLDNCLISCMQIKQFAFRAMDNVCLLSQGRNGLSFKIVDLGNESHGTPHGTFGQCNKVNLVPGSRPRIPASLGENDIMVTWILQTPSLLGPS